MKTELRNSKSNEKYNNVKINNIRTTNKLLFTNMIEQSERIDMINIMTNLFSKKNIIKQSIKPNQPFSSNKRISTHNIAQNFKNELSKNNITYSNYESINDVGRSYNVGKSILQISSRNKVYKIKDKANDNMLKYEDFVSNNKNEANIDFIYKYNSNNTIDLTEKPSKIYNKKNILIKQTNKVKGKNLLKCTPIHETASLNKKSTRNIEIDLEIANNDKYVFSSIETPKMILTNISIPADNLPLSSSPIVFKSEEKIFESKEHQLDCKNSFEYSKETVKNDDSINYENLEYNCDVLEEVVDNRKVYKSLVKTSINSLYNVNYKQELEEIELNNYNKLISKYLNNDNQSTDCKIEDDINYISTKKDNMRGVKNLYKHELRKIRNELNELIDFNNFELEKINYKIDLNPTENNQVKIKLLSDLEKLRKQFIEKERDYKKTIKSLLLEWKNINNRDISKNDMSELFDANETITKELNDILSDDKISLNDSKELFKIKKGKYKKSEEDSDSILEEFRNFKNEDSSIYKYEIPVKYQISNNIKIKNEQSMTDGRILRYYENSVIEVISKNKNITRLFPDNYQVTFYNNKDIKQIFPSGKIIIFYYKNKSYEFNMKREGYKLYMFHNRQIEKHFYDGRKHIKFPDNSIKIIRPNGEEVNEFFDKTIQKKDKNGNIRTII